MSKKRGVTTVDPVRSNDLIQRDKDASEKKLQTFISKRTATFDNFSEIERADGIPKEVQEIKTGYVFPKLYAMLHEGMKGNKKGFSNVTPALATKSITTLHEHFITNATIPEKTKIDLFNSHKKDLLERMDFEIQPTMMDVFAKFNL